MAKNCTAAERDAERLSSMLGYIHEHYMERLDVETVAQSAAISTSESLRCFKRNLNTSPVSYIRDYRIKRAVEMLGNGARSISETAFACGFEDMSYFSKIFRSTTGMSPSEYKDTWGRS